MNTNKTQKARAWIIATSKCLWVKADGFASNGMYGTLFGADKKEALARLSESGYTIYDDTIHGTLCRR